MNKCNANQSMKYSNSLDYRANLWICQVKEFHNNKYDYSLVDYKTQHIKVIILCPEHGEFSQRPCDHKTQGCPKCSHNFPLSSEEFINRSKQLYGNKYTLLGNFIGIKHKVELSCGIHGVFALKKAENHFLKNGGCPSCWKETKLDNLKTGNISKKETEWLDSLGVPERQVRMKFDDCIFVVDGYDPATKTVYEYYGSYWHGNPSKYNLSDMHPILKCTFNHLYEKTIQREQIIREKFNLVVTWD
jgi:hypothetical protein